MVKDGANQFGENGGRGYHLFCEEACDASVLKLQRKRERKRCEEAGEASALAGGKRSLWGGERKHASSAA